MATLLIRPLAPADIAAVAQLLAELARSSITPDFEPEAAEAFLRSNDAGAIRRMIDEGFQYWVAECGPAIVGFVGMRNHSHLFHLFVAQSHQRQGIARRLWEVARKACRAAGNPGRFTVNSSNNALPVYEAFGFRRSLPTQNTNGVLYNPMVLDADHEASEAGHWHES